MEPMKPRLPRTVKVIPVIFTEAEIGTGITPGDPCRTVQQYWSLEGQLLATHDDWLESQPKGWNPHGQVLDS